VGYGAEEGVERKGEGGMRVGVWWGESRRERRAICKPPALNVTGMGLVVVLKGLRPRLIDSRPNAACHLPALVFAH